jgi:LacI family transcriptional regulator
MASNEQINDPFDERVAPTIYDVARAAGVSIGTISKALNGKGNLPTETRERIRAVADELGFRPNELAQSLVRKRSFTVGLLISDIYERTMPLLEGIEDTLAAEQFSVFLCNARNDPERERRYIAALLAKQVDGIIVAGRRLDRRPPIDVGQSRVPIVYVYSPADDPQALSLMPYEVHGTRLAIEHLITRGRRRMAHISGPNEHTAVQLRESTMRYVLAEHGQDLPANRVVNGAWQEHVGYQAAQTLLQRDSSIDAIFCGSDILARGAIDGLRDLGVRVPQTVAIVGFHNLQALASAARPPITSVDPNLHELGRQASQHLLDLIAGKPKSGVFQFPCRLVVRQSCGGEPTDINS